MIKSKIIKIDIDDETQDYNNTNIFLLYSNFIDYELAYWINKSLDLCLKRTEKETSISKFPFFYFENNFNKFQLIKNRVFFEEKNQNNNLFVNTDVENFYYLYEHKKDVDYFFIIKDYISDCDLKKNIKKIRNIKDVMLVTPLERGKDNLEYINLDKKIYFQ